MTSVAVAMAVHNGAATVEAAIASIRLQTLEDWQLVIVDDGSTDETPAIINRIASQDSRILPMHHQPSRGLAVSLGRILDVVDTTYVARMDADDIAYPRRFERQVEFLSNRPEIDLVGGAMVIVRSDGSVIGKRRAPAEHADICRHPRGSFSMFHPTWMARTAWFHRWLYRPIRWQSQDWDLLYRSHRDSTFANIPDPLLGYREEPLKLRGILTGRRTIVKIAGGDLWRNGQRFAAARTAAEHTLKGTVDMVAIKTGLNHKLLRHRAGPISDAEVAEWARVWEAVQEFVASERYSSARSPSSRSSE